MVSDRPACQARSQAPDRRGWSPCVNRRYRNGLRHNRLTLTLSSRRFEQGTSVELPG